MNMILTTPSTVHLPSDSDEVRNFLTYADTAIQYQINMLSKKYHWKKNDPDAFNAKMEDLKAQQKKCLVRIDTDGKPYTYAGLWPVLRTKFGWDINVSDQVKCPPPTRMIPWAHVPEHEIRYYQDEAVEALFASSHQGPVSIELPTGAGKSRIIHEICHRNPVRTLVITPSKNITNALYTEMLWLFGAKYVGKYGDGKKDIGKLFTVCTAQSLKRVQEGTPQWDFFSSANQLVWDESHTTPAATFEQVELGLLRNVQNRFHLSATQMRGDGSDLLLQGIIGPIVYSKSFTELVDEGFLARPFFKIFKVPTFGSAGWPNIDDETRNQLYLNPNVNKLASEFAIKSIALAGRQTVILIDEFVQYLKLKPFLKDIPHEFAHGGVPQDEKRMFEGREIRDYFTKDEMKPDVSAMVRRFNSGETDLLVGTSAISTGVDLKPTGCLIYLQGGMSEVKVKQAIGRGTRVTPTKKDVVIVDFIVVGSPSMERHGYVRVDIYKELGDVQEYKL